MIIFSILLSIVFYTFEIRSFWSGISAFQSRAFVRGFRGRSTGGVGSRAEARFFPEMFYLKMSGWFLSGFFRFCMGSSKESSDWWTGYYWGFLEETLSERSDQTSSAGFMVGMICFEGKRRMGAIS